MSLLSYIALSLCCGGIAFLIVSFILQEKTLKAINTNSELIKEQVYRSGYQVERIDYSTANLPQRTAEATLRELDSRTEARTSRQETPTGRGYVGSSTRGQTPTPTYPHELEQSYTTALRRYYDATVHGGRSVPQADGDSRAPQESVGNSQEYYGGVGRQLAPAQCANPNGVLGSMGLRGQDGWNNPLPQLLGSYDPTTVMLAVSDTPRSALELEDNE